MESQILPPPSIIMKHGDAKVYQPDLLRKLPVQKGLSLKHNKWIVVYEYSSFDYAEKLYGLMYDASKKLNMAVEEPYWIELNKEDDYKSLY